MTTDPLDESVSTFTQSPGLVVAAHALFNSERIVSSDELLISTAMDILSDGAQPIDRLLAGCNAVWPGAGIAEDRLRHALDEARPLGLVTRGEDLLGETWSVTDAGNDEALATRNWYADAIGRLNADIQSRAEDDFGVVSRDQVALWSELLLEALMNGVWTSEGVLKGHVERGLSGNDLRPMGLDPKRMLQHLESHTMDAEVLEFLRACVLAAIDESDPLANEVMSYIAVAGTLHAIAAGRDRVPAQDLLGPIAGQRLVIDTPVLLTALGGTEDSRAMSRLIANAVDLGLDVVVPQHVVDELESVLDRVERDALPGLRQALAEGMRPSIFRELVDEQVLQIYLDAVRDDDHVRSWEQWRARTRQQVSSLAAVGVSIREHGNLDDESVEQCRAELAEELSRRNHGRGDVPIERDAHSMGMVRRSRARNRRFSSSLWPGGWILTLDTYLSPAYARLDPDDEANLTISPSSLALLLAECAEPPSVRALVSSAASLARREAMISIAMRYPPEVALDFCKHLSEDFSATDSRVAQLRFDEVIERNSGHPSLSGARLASDLAAKRMKRMKMATEAQQARLRDEAAAADRARREAESRYEGERRSRLRLEKDLSKQKQGSSTDRALGKRRTLAAVIVTSLVGLAVVSLVLGVVWTAIGVLGAAALFWERSRRWVSDESASWFSQLFAAIPVALSLLDLFVPIGR